jgi:O-acetyl-ADP-ribose deacetylase (regulator of RNase III)
VIEERRGNVLTADVDALVNTVNTVGVMGKGIALQFKRAHPANYAAYRAAYERGELEIGRIFVFDTGRLGSGRYILNFPTKRHWRSGSRIEDIRAGLDDLVRVVQDLRITSVAVPALGAGNGGLDWRDVRPLIAEAAARMPDTRVLVFPPVGAPAADAMPVGTPRPAMTRSRAMLLVTIARYLAQANTLESRAGVSELEIQKLAYFLQVFGLPLGLRFHRGRYGPYAETLHPVLQEMEGHQIVGYGDRSAPVLDLQPIQVTTDGDAEAVAWLVGDSDAEDMVDAVMRLVEGFETPYSVELLATVHFASSHDGVAADDGALSEVVASWSLRKARLFTDEHVRLAADRLRERALLVS